MDETQTAQPLQNLYAGVAEKEVYTLETYRILEGGESEMDTVKLISTSTGTLFIVEINDIRFYR